MADVVWPVSLPSEALLAGLEETPPLLVARTEMSVGPAKVRRRFTAGVRGFTAQLQLTRAQVATFDDFFTQTIQGGALPFTWTHPRTGNPIDYRIVGQPRYRPQAPRTATNPLWTIDLELEALPGTEITGPTPPPPDPDQGMLLIVGSGQTSADGPPVVDLPQSLEAVDVFLGPTDSIIFDSPAPGMEDLIVMDPRESGVDPSLDELVLVVMPESGTGVLLNRIIEADAVPDIGDYGGVIGGGVSGGGVISGGGI